MAQSSVVSSATSDLARISSAPPSPGFLNQTIQAISAHFKPHRAEALYRIRINMLGLIFLAVLTNLLPVPFPSLQTAAWAVSYARGTQRWETDTLWRWLCLFEASLAGLMAFNVLEGTHALNYPPPPLPPHPASPSVRKEKLLKENRAGLSKAAQSPKRPFSILSANISPQTQLPFSSPRLSSSLSGSGSVYPLSPLSSPSKTLRYPSLSTNTTATQASSISMLNTPSPNPIVKGYASSIKAKGRPARPLDESILIQLGSSEAGGQDDDDEDNN